MGKNYVNISMKIPDACIFCQAKLTATRERLDRSYRKIACLCNKTSDSYFSATYRFCLFFDEFKDIFKRTIIVIGKYKAITTYPDFEGLRSGTEIFIEGPDFQRGKAILYLADPIPIETLDQALSLEKNIPSLLIFS